MSPAPRYPVPRAAQLGGLVLTQRCPRCRAAVVATDYRAAGAGGRLRRVWLDARDVDADLCAPEHRCERAARGGTEVPA